MFRTGYCLSIEAFTQQTSHKEQTRVGLYQKQISPNCTQIKFHIVVWFDNVEEYFGPMKCYIV
jgi:hypothetical protein